MYGNLICLCPHDPPFTCVPAAFQFAVEVLFRVVECEGSIMFGEPCPKAGYANGPSILRVRIQHVYINCRHVYVVRPASDSFQVRVRYAGFQQLPIIEEA